MAATTLPDDPALPAVAHLVGDEATRMLDVVVTAADGQLLHSRPSHVQYRPGADAVVRFEAWVAWSDGTVRRETLLAATSSAGAPAGTVPVAANVQGRDVEIGVWRWPFDPVLTALRSIVTPSLAASALGGHVVRPVDLRVVAYRPTERAVVRTVDADGTVLYVKVLPPPLVGALVERHDRLRAGGLPVPEIVGAGDGWVAMTELPGPTWRDLIKGADGEWPSPDDLAALLRRLRGVDVPGHAARSRTVDAAGHATLLRRVHPEFAPAIDRLTALLAPRDDPPTDLATVHGDLHEAQLVVSDGQLVGLLDVDDAGRGDPLDDMATLVAHTMFRAVVANSTTDAARLTRYADRLETVFAVESDRLGRSNGELRRAIAAVLVGLATGPFRVQRVHWRDEVAAVLACAERTAVGHG
jgi:aminoglycoside phosphotransferase